MAKKQQSSHKRKPRSAHRELTLTREQIEKDEQTRVVVYLSRSLHAKLKAMLAEDDRSVSWWARKHAEADLSGRPAPKVPKVKRVLGGKGGKKAGKKRGQRKSTR